MKIRTFMASVLKKLGGFFCKKLGSFVIVAGMGMPGLVYAVDIPLADPGFEDYVVNASIGYAYSDEYYPTSGWIDDPDLPGENDGVGNWVYDATYAEPDGGTGSGVGRGAPVGGGQAMHGRASNSNPYYNGQVVSDTFEPGKTYTFSIYAQGDDNTIGDESKVYLYIYDGNGTFSEETAFASERFSRFEGDFVNRVPDDPETTEVDEGWTQAQSQAAWEQISFSHTVLPGASEIGHPIGVAFRVFADGAVDNATLTEETPTELLAVIDRTGTSDRGNITLYNYTGSPVTFGAYRIHSNDGALDPQEGAWTPISGSGLDPGGDWIIETNRTDPTYEALQESNGTGTSVTIADGGSIDLGDAWIKWTGDISDLEFEYTIPGGSVIVGQALYLGDDLLSADLDFDGDIDADDWLAWVDGLGSTSTSAALAYQLGDLTGDLTTNHDDFVAFQAAYELANPGSSFAEMIASIPEPSSLVLISLGLIVMNGSSRRRRLRAPPWLSSCSIC